MTNQTTFINQFFLAFFINFFRHGCIFVLKYAFNPIYPAYYFLALLPSSIIIFPSYFYLFSSSNHLSIIWLTFFIIAAEWDFIEIIALFIYLKIFIFIIPTCSIGYLFSVITIQCHQQIEAHLFFHHLFLFLLQIFLLLYCFLYIKVKEVWRQCALLSCLFLEGRYTCLKHGGKHFHYFIISYYIIIVG